MLTVDRYESDRNIYLFILKSEIVLPLDPFYVHQMLVAFGSVDFIVASV